MASASEKVQRYRCDLLNPAAIKEVRVDFTERCNARCVYCSVSSKEYTGIEMPVAVTQRSVDLISCWIEQHPEIEVDVNGNGETTYRKGWIDLIRPLLALGIPVRIQSNFAKEFALEELEVLASMKAITISVDSADRRLLAQLRRKIDIRQIIANITTVRATAVRLLKRPPIFIFACGLYDKNALFVEDVARLAIALHVQTVDFWTLYEHQHFDKELSSTERVYPLHSLPDEDLRPRLTAIRKDITLMRSKGIVVSIHANFIDDLAKRVGLSAEEDDAPEAEAPSPKQSDAATRDCTFAWTNVEIKANGDVRPCCVRSPVGNLAEMSITDILNGPRIRRLREGLLSGALDGDCASCRLMPMTQTGPFVEKVQKLLDEIDVPKRFDGEAYLTANPDVANAKVNPTDHFLSHGRFEGRPLFPR